MKNSKIELLNKVYHIGLEETSEAYYVQSNNDASLKKIYQHLENADNVEIEGNGAKLVFHDRISPFVLSNSSNITIKNITIDYERPFFTQGIIEYADHDSIVLRIDKEFPYYVKEGQLVFCGEKWESNMLQTIVLMQEFDPQYKAPAYNAPVILSRIGEGAEPDPLAPFPLTLLGVKEIEKGVIILSGKFPYVCKRGNVMVLSHEKRENSVFFINKCENIHLENIEINHSGSMGVIAQFSKDIYLKNVRITPPIGSNRMVSTNADATHFVHCYGKIDITGCHFERMLDDGTNIHGIYTKVERIISENEIVVGFGHFQQYGLMLYEPGDKVVITKGSTKEERGIFKIKEIRKLDDKTTILTLIESTNNIHVGDVLECQEKMPEVKIEHTYVGKNRPRGFLLNTPKTVLVEHCVFENCSYGIHIAGDANFWFESGSVTNVLIQNNKFEDCCYQGGDFAIAITPEYRTSHLEPYYHKNITIQNNTFNTFTDGIVYANGVDGLTVVGNLLEESKTYHKRISTKPIVIKNCVNFDSDMDCEVEQI